VLWALMRASADATISDVMPRVFSLAALSIF
jgi:hypothetical protein